MRNSILKMGKGFLSETGTLLDEAGVSGKILYVSDSIVDKLYGDVVRSQIKQIGRLKEETVENNTISYSMTIAERIIATDINCIVGFGGGKVLDVCKYAAYVSKRPFLSIPTAVANDGIASPIAVLKRQDGKPKSLGSAPPTMLLLDIDLIINSPLQLIKAGIGDTISNYMALKDWKLACDKGKDEMNGYAYLMSQTSLDVLMKTQFNSICPEFIEVLVRSIILSGLAMELAGSSRPVSGSEHMFSHALDIYSDHANLHGLQVALGTVAMLMLLGEDYSDVLTYLKKFNVNINPASLGITVEMFIMCMQKAITIRNDRYTYLHEIELSENKLRELYYRLMEET